MTFIVEGIILCALFTLMVYLMSRNPLKTVYNYPPRIQQRVRSLKEYAGMVPTKKDKLATKLIACVFFVIVISLILRFINGCTGFGDAFLTGFILWTIVNRYDAIVLDIIWFCHDPHFVIKGTEDMVSDYHDYMFHIKGFFIGEAIALVVCLLSAAVVQLIP